MRSDMSKHSSPVLIVGSVAFDSVKTPLGEVDNVLGGAAVYAATAAAFFSPVQLVGVAGRFLIKQTITAAETILAQPPLKIVDLCPVFARTFRDRQNFQPDRIEFQSPQSEHPL